MPAYYNEMDPFAAAWLRELIARNLIAPGVVDERSIEAVTAHDLDGFEQCHFFAGIGVWSYALRLAGWPDDRPVWTGSCPCPPFSSAGKQKPCPRCGGSNPVPHVGRTGYFVCCLCDHEWLADGRHLYPEFRRLIAERRPEFVFGEQVASRDGRTWLALVRASLEIVGYAVGVADISAAIVGAPHIRQRLYFVANAERVRFGSYVGDHDRGQPDSARGFEASGLGKPDGDGSRSRRIAGEAVGQGSAADSAGCHDTLAVTINAERRASVQPGQDERNRSNEGREETHRYAGACSDVRGVGDASSARFEGIESQELCGAGRRRERGAVSESGHSFWTDCDWLPCTDGKARPVEPGTFPLAHGAPARVGRLRGYGNAINAEQAAAFIEAFLDVRGG